MATAVALLGLVGCDDTVFAPHGGGGGGGYPADWDGVSAFMDDHCATCHAPGTGLYVLPDDVEADILAGDEVLVVPGDPDASLLWQVLVSEGDPTPMPMGSSLSDTEIQHVRLWLYDGAPL